MADIHTQAGRGGHAPEATPPFVIRSQPPTDVMVVSEEEKSCISLTGSAFNPSRVALLKSLLEFSLHVFVIFFGVSPQTGCILVFPIELELYLTLANFAETSFLFFFFLKYRFI